MIKDGVYRLCMQVSPNSWRGLFAREAQAYICLIGLMFEDLKLKMMSIMSVYTANFIVVQEFDIK